MEKPLSAHGSKVHGQDVLKYKVGIVTETANYADGDSKFVTLKHKIKQTVIFDGLGLWNNKWILHSMQINVRYGNKNWDLG